jgi:Ferritin-like domain
MSHRQLDADTILDRAKPVMHQEAREIHPYGQLIKLPIGLAENVCKERVANLNQLLADTITLRDLYKKHHWQAAGPTSYQLHLLFDKHFAQQGELVDAIAERIQLLWVQRIERRIVDVGREHALFEIVEDHDAGRATSSRPRSR